MEKEFRDASAQRGENGKLILALRLDYFCCEPRENDSHSISPSKIIEKKKPTIIFKYLKRF